VWWHVICYVVVLSDVELENRLQEAGTLHRAVLDLCQRRERRLQKARDAAEKLHSIVSDISSQLSHIRDDAAAIHSVPATDRATIQHHLSELQVAWHVKLRYFMLKCNNFVRRKMSVLMWCKLTSVFLCSSTNSALMATGFFCSWPGGLELSPRWFPGPENWHRHLKFKKYNLIKIKA